MKINISSIKVAVGVAIFSMALMLFQFLYVGIVLKKETEKNSNEIALQTAQKIANSVEVYFRDALTVTHTYSHNFLTYRKASIPRITVYQIMNGSLSLNKNFLAIWTMWEPNAYDNKDFLYKNDTIHDSNGNFAIAYYYDGNTIKQEINDTADYYEDFYMIPKKYQEPIILDPFYYQYHGNSKTYFETSMVSPIIENNKFLGVMGIDIDMYELQETYSKTRVFNDGFICLLSNSGVIVTHKSPEFIEKKIQEYAAEDSSLITDSLKSGKPFITESYSNFSNEVAVRHFYPINMSNMAAPWYVMIEIPKSTILKESNRLKTISTIILIASLILLWYLSYNIFDRNRKEKKLKDIIKKVEQGETLIKESELRYRKLIEAFPDLILATDLNHRILYANSAMEKYANLHLDEIKYTNEIIKLHPDDKSYVDSEIANLLNLELENTGVFDYRILKNGMVAWFSSVVCRIDFDGAPALLYFLKDITQRKKIEQELKESEERYKTLMDSMNEVIIVADNNHIVQYVNKQFTLKLGYTPEEIIGTEGYRILHDPEDLWMVEEANSKRLDNQTSSYELTFKAKNGIKFDFMVSGAPYKNIHGETMGSIGALMDITDRKKAEQELKESEERFKTLSSIASEGLMIHENGIIVDLNLTFAKILGYSSIEELIGKDALTTISFTEDSKKLVFEHFKNESDATFDIEIIQLNGTILPTETRGIEITYKGRKANLVYIRDISARKKAEKELENYRNHLELLVKERTHELDASNEELQASNEELNSQRNALEETLQNLKNTQNQLIQAEKMASLGVLTAGVAHEINNPLNYIYNGTAAIENYIKENYSDETHILNTLFEAVTTGVERISGIVKSMSRYSRKEDLPYANCDIHEVIDDCLIMLHNKYKNRIEIIKNYLTEPAITFANEGQLHQVILNIIANSIQAIENKGIITINVSIDKKFYSISITDTGKGIRNEYLDKIFDPFFTTKNPGEGTGLGLSITKKIIEEHSGTISCESVLNSHTKFIIRLPIKS